MDMKTMYRDHWPIAAFALSVLFGGFNAIGVHFIVLELPPFWGATLRFAPASMLLFLLVFILKLPLPQGRAFQGAILFGALNFGASYAFLYYGLEKVQPGMTQVIMALVPLFTLLFAITHHQENFRWHSLIGALLAAAGIGLVFMQQLGASVPFSSLLAIILGAASFAEAGVIAKSFPKSHPITTNAVGMATGAAILFLMSFVWHENQVLPAKAATWTALIFLILIGSCVVFILFLYILKRWSVSTTSYQFVLLPFVTLLASTWLAHETLSPILLGGAALVLTGVFIGIRNAPQKLDVQSVVPEEMR
ncbi:MAG: EamA family transporter [Chloroflexi bacterium]|nr:EamA family transporter [Chloroflexota bacterium]